MKINDAVVIAELMDRQTVYERALMDNDVEVLQSLFWESPHAVRYGITENLYGVDEIRAFRQGRPTVNVARTVTRVEIAAVGDSAGVVNLEFVRPIGGTERAGRQTQFWIRFPEGWKILSSHISLLPGPKSYLDAAAAQIGVPVDAMNRAAVSEDLNRIGVVARFLMEFPLSQGQEPAAVFQP